MYIHKIPVFNFIITDKIIDKRKTRKKEGLMSAHNLRMQFITAERAWCQGHEGVGCSVLTEDAVLTTFLFFFVPIH